MTGVVWLSTLLLLALPGAALLAHRAFRSLAPVPRVILAGAAGSTLVSLTMTVFALAGARWSLAGVLAGSFLLGLGLRAALRGAPAEAAANAAEAPANRSGRPFSTIAHALSAAAVLAALLATAAGSASSPDLLFFWGPKAQRFALARTVDARYLADPLLAYMHAYYPPLVTNLYALASMTAGRMSWTAATLLFPLLLAALALALPGLLRTIAPLSEAAAMSALAVGTLAVIGAEADIAGNADMPLLLYETLAMALLLSPVSAGAAGQLLAGLLLAGAACAKVEGLPFALAAIAAFLWVRRESARPLGRAALRLCAPVLLSLSVWFAFGSARGLFYGYSGEGRLLDFHPEYAGVVARSVARALASTGYGLPFGIPLVVLLLTLRRGSRRVSLIPLVTAAALLGFLLLVYLDRSANPSDWIAWSAARVLAPIPVLLSLAACAAGPPKAYTPPATRP